MKMLKFVLAFGYSIKQVSAACSAQTLLTPKDNADPSVRFNSYTKEGIQATVGKATETFTITNPLEHWTNENSAACPITQRGVLKNTAGDALDGGLENMFVFSQGASESLDTITINSEYYTGGTVTV